MKKTYTNFCVLFAFCGLLISTGLAYGEQPLAREEALSDFVQSLLAPVRRTHPHAVHGKRGTGKQFNPPLPAPFPTSPSRFLEVGRQNAGAGIQPFSTMRADLSEPTNTLYPYRAIGKLFLKNGDKTLECGGTLIKRGLVLTAAHCVAVQGKERFFSDFQFIPGYRNGEAPYGIWTGTPFVLRSYFDGSVPCENNGRLCRDDVALIRLFPQAGAYPGTATGWLGYGWDGWGFTDEGLTQVTQLGYPGCLNGGRYLIRNDAQGYRSVAKFDNTLIGSLMCGGASGGPWITNFGLPAKITANISGGLYSDENIIVGVTSWVDTDNKQNGASPFLTTNVARMVEAVCKSAPDACGE